MTDLQLQNDWAKLLEQEKQKAYFQELESYLEKEYEEHIVYPKKEDIFNCLRYTSFKEVKVVILGQDPYHGPDQAHGLSFSVKPGVPIPTSLKNIYKELKEDIGCPIPSNGYLKNWAKQGVLLLNTVMTVRAGKANTHRGEG